MADCLSLNPIVPSVFADLVLDHAVAELPQILLELLTLRLTRLLTRPSNVAKVAAVLTLLNGLA